MFRKVLPLISLGLMCSASAEAPSHIQSPHSEKSSKHAISSQSFHRDDVPLSYKYSSVHIYTTSKPQLETNEHSQSHSGYNSAVPSYYHSDDHQTQEHQYKHYVPVETVVPQKPEPQSSAYEVNDYEQNSPSYETKYVQPQSVVSEPKQYYRPSYLPPTKPESHSQLGSVVKIPSHNSYLHYNQQQSVHTRPSQNYLPVSLYQPHQQVSASAPAQQQAEYQTHENPDKKTVLLYSVIPSSQHTHAPSRYQYQQTAAASHYEPKPSGTPLVYFKIGQSNGHSSPYHTNAKAHKVYSVPAAAHSQEASTYQYDIKPSPYMYLLQKHRELISN